MLKSQSAADLTCLISYCQGKMPEDEMLKTKILPMFPPVFHKWFLTTFSEPAAWFRARLAYAHTTAVWSMVGHIVGLGDRHGENILFDSTSGDCVHVDFSCLFDRGLLLDKPELVPFRLTQVRIYIASMACKKKGKCYKTYTRICIFLFFLFIKVFRPFF
jgi:phosphatidylinositol kinase/protein kinase (PI-3  family)